MDLTTARPEIRDRSDYKRSMNALLDIDPSRAVVLTIDMQWDYLDTETGTSPVSAEAAERVLARSEELLDLARSHGIPVIHVYVVRRPIETERGFTLPAYGKTSQGSGLSQNAQAPARTAPSRLEGTHQSQVPARLVRPTDLHVTSKRVTDAFHDTELDMLLRRVFQPEVVVLTGINTDTCVYGTTFAASCRGYRPVVISDCVASSRGDDHHWMALELMSRSIAWVLTVDEFREKLEPGPARDIHAGEAAVAAHAPGRV